MIVATTFAIFLLAFVVESLQHRKPSHHLHDDELNAHRCPFSRDDAIGLARKYFDREVNPDGTRGDGYLCQAEVKQGLLAVMSYAELFGAAATLVWTTVSGSHSRYSLETIFSRCDADHDGYISPDDFEKSRDTCLRDCEALGDFFDKVKRAETMKLNLPEVQCE